MSIPVYEIYALKYAGPLSRPAALLSWFQDLDKHVQMPYYFFAIRGGGETIVVDCGVDPEAARQRGLAGYVSPAEVLKRIGIDAARVRHLILTHIHFDHASGIRLFPRADVYVQKKEFDFWIKDPMAKRAPFLSLSDPAANKYLGRLEGKKRLRLIRGDRKIFPGIELLLAPGHTPGLQVIAVNTARGTAVVGSDLAHLASSYRTDLPSMIITDLTAWMKSYDKVRPRAASPDLLFPGHDPALLENYPRAAEDVSRLA